MAARPPHVSPLPQQGVLVLRNGEILEGKVTRAGDLYYVVLKDGEIRVPVHQVEFACGNLDEAYQRKRASSHTGDLYSHLQLAQWCQRHGLVDAAAKELDQAAAADPTHPMIALVRRRLLASAAVPETLKPLAASTASSPNAEALNRLVREMPPDSVETFSHAIQPLLLNGCTTSGCHGPRSQSQFRLLRGRPGSLPRRPMTQRNLYATLHWVDRTRPEASHLLAVLGQAHGGQKKAYLEQRPAQYQQIVDWVQGLGRTVEEADRQDATSVPASAEAGDAMAIHAMAWEPAASQDARNKPSEQAPPRSGLKRGQPPKRFVPVDPFDPEIFNQQFRAEP